MVGDIVAYLKERGRERKEKELILEERLEIVRKIMLRETHENP